MDARIVRGLCAWAVMFALGGAAAWAQNSPPEVTNVTAGQRPDASKLVDITYDLSDADGNPCTVWVAISDDDGATWRVPAYTFTGDVGPGITPGTGKAIVWDAGHDIPGRTGSLFKARVSADDGQGSTPMVFVEAGWFPYQNASDPGDWVFVESLMIDKYEVTNQFYCEFLNNADPNGDHWIDGMEIYRYGDPGNYYYSVATGRENYPIRYTNRYDAEAFAVWRSSVEGATFRLPTEEEWEKAAAWDPVVEHYYLYGFHQDTIDCPWCNYNNCVGGPTEVGHYDGTGGTNDAKSYYGAYDMSGNVWEWTSGIEGSNGVLRGGAWYNSAASCQASFRSAISPGSRYDDIGFRLVLDLD